MKLKDQWFKKNVTYNTTVLFVLVILIKCLLPFSIFILDRLDLTNSGYNIRTFNFTEYLDFYSRSDSNWYRIIAEYSYDSIPDFINNTWKHPHSHFAFFPLYPMLVKTIMVILSTDFQTAAFIFSLVILLSLVKSVMILLDALNYPPDLAYKMVILYIFFPFSMHFFFNYTEALFFTLLCLSFASILKGNIKTFLFCAAGLVLCRPNGMFLGFPFLLLIIEKRQLLKKSINNWFREPWLWALITIPITLVFWLTLQWCWVGDALAFSHAQSSWNKVFMFPLLALFRHGFWDYQFVSVYCVIFLIYAIYMIRKLRVSDNLLIWINLLLPLSGGSVISMLRYTSILFPLHFDWQKRIINSRYLYLTIFLFVFSQLILVKFWFEGQALMF